MPLANILQDKVHPNTITLSALLVGLIASFFISIDFRITAVMLLFVSGYLDILDGSIDRIRQTSSQIGTMLDILSDRLVESAIVIGLFIRQPELGLVALLMMMSMLICVLSFLLVGIFIENNGQKSFHYSDGLMERGEAFILFIIMIIWPQICFVIGILFAILVFWTAFYRVYEFTKNSIPETK